MPPQEPCSKFASRFKVPNPDETKTCGLCDAYTDCSLPQKRDPRNNGRTTYQTPNINTEAIITREHPKNTSWSPPKTPRDRNG